MLLRRCPTHSRQNQRPECRKNQENNTRLLSHSQSAGSLFPLSLLSSVNVAVYKKPLSFFEFVDINDAACNSLS